MGTYNTKRTFRLFAVPSFLEGMMRVVDIAGTLNVYNESETEEKADSFALQSDWLAVGDDIRIAMSHHAQFRESTVPSK